GGYFGCLVGLLVAIVWVSMACYSITDNVVVTACSFWLSSMVMLVYYGATRGMVESVGVLVLALICFVVLELSVLAVLVVAVAEPGVLWAIPGVFYDSCRRAIVNKIRR
ncbi:hypothetical protein NEHOM01_0920, partial [Nematocida homosporus]|uniref:uncharacterized protein n=1 Tax=Nematocida homosporus TaxID=1912981 RepID=UPI00221ED5F8